MQTVTLHFHLKKEKLNAKTLKAPFYMAVYGNGRVLTRLNSMFDVSQDQLYKWNPFTERMNGKDFEVNEYLDYLSVEFNKIKRKIIYEDCVFTAQEIVNILLNKKEVVVKQKVYQYALNFLQEDVENNLSMTIGTKKNYRNAIKQFCNYLEFKKIKDIDFDEFKFKEADGFKKYLEMDVPSLKNKIKNSVVSSSTKIKNIKPVFEKAINEELITQNPFKKIKMVMVNTEKVFNINMNQFNRILEVDLSANEQLQFTKNIFIFMCYTGMSISDVQLLTPDSFELDKDGNWFLDTRRLKTEMIIKQVLVKPAAEILMFYKNKGYHRLNKFIFPYEHLNTINRKLKLVAALANIKENISTKTARHTCTNFLASAGLQDPILINYYMGWSRSSFMKDRYSNFSREVYVNFSKVFEKFLIDNTTNNN